MATLPRPLAASAQLIALFDAFADCERAKNTMIQLHDYDGQTLEALRTWAGSRHSVVYVSPLTVQGVVHDQYDVDCGDGRLIVVHANQTRRPANEERTADSWRPTDGHA